MAGLHALDRVIGDQWPSLTAEADQRAFESVPYQDRIAAHSTYQALQCGASRAPQSPAILFLPNASADDHPISLTHIEFVGRVTQVANALHSRGVGPRDVVSLLLPLIPQAFYALYGAQAAGIANPINSFLEPDQIAHILRAARSKVVITDAATLEKVSRVRAELPDLNTLLIVGAAVEGAEDFDKLIESQPADRLISDRQIESSDVGAYYHTGGTTGLPQLVPLTHGNQVYQAWGMALMFRTKPGSTLLMGLPLFHVGGALTQALQHLSAGGTLVVLSAAGWRNRNAMSGIWRLVDRFKPELLGGVPTVLGAALSVSMDGADASSIRMCTGGGSPVPVAVADAYRDRFGVPVLETYGMTEVSSCHTISYPERPIHHGSVGHALPYSRVGVFEVDERGKECPVGKIGIIGMYGPGVFSGYLTGAPDAPFLKQGWVNSGDLGRINENGYLWITGRAKDLIIRGGHNIDPAGIEEVLYHHPAVALAAVVGEPDAYAGELPVGYVQLKPGAQADIGEIIKFAAAHTPERAAVPTQLYIVDTVPLTAVGKVFKPALRLDAAERAVRRLLSFLQDQGCVAHVKAQLHEQHGTLITVRISGSPEVNRDRILEQAKAKLDPLTLRHDLKWQSDEDRDESHERKIG
jgi:fatty-acyl-CoA synthase